MSRGQTPTRDIHRGRGMGRAVAGQIYYLPSDDVTDDRSISLSNELQTG